MKTMTTIILGMLRALGPNHLDTEDAAAREARLTTLADGMTWATEAATCTGDFEKEDCKPISRLPPEEHAVYLFTIGKWESGNFAQHIHEDRCRVHLGECDGGKAKSNFQVQATGRISLALWRQIGGTDQRSTRLAAWAASLALGTVQGCGTPARVFAGYATSRCGADFPQAGARAAEWRKYLADYRARHQALTDTRE